MDGYMYECMFVGKREGYNGYMVMLGVYQYV